MILLRRALCMILTLVMVIGMFPVSSYATDGSFEAAGGIIETVPYDGMSVPEIIPEAPVVDLATYEPEVYVADIQLPAYNFTQENGNGDILQQAAPLDSVLDIPSVLSQNVIFTCYPESLVLTILDMSGAVVYSAAGMAQHTVCLEEGYYTYFAACENYVSIENAGFAVQSGQNAVIAVALQEVVVDAPAGDFVIEQMPPEESHDDIVVNYPVTFECAPEDLLLTITDSFGAVIYSGAAAAHVVELPEGTYSYSAVRDGYEAVEAVITITGDEQVNHVDVALTALPAEPSVLEVTQWVWIDTEAVLVEGVLSLPGSAEDNLAQFADIVSILPQSVDTEYGELFVVWNCPDYPIDGAYTGTYSFSASLPEGFDLAEGAAPMTVMVTLGGAETLEYISGTFNGSPAEVDASGNLAINEANFPDANFRQYISDNFDINGTGVLTVSQVEGIISIECNECGIASLKGIEYFTDLIRLSCYGNSISTLNIGANIALVDLDCSNNYLTVLDLSNNPQLSVLKCSNNVLTSLNVSVCPGLSQLDCSANGMSFTKLDLSDNKSLKDLSCGGNGIAILDLRSCTALENLNCASSSSLTAISLNGCAALKSVDCQKNPLMTSLDLLGCTALESLNCSDCSSLVNLKIADSKAMKTLDCRNTAISALNVSGFTALQSLSCTGCKNLKTFDASACVSLKSLSCSNTQMLAMNVSGCSSLTSLRCNDNQLTSLNVSGCSELNTLYCYNNKLATLDLSNLSKLSKLRCQDNLLTTMKLNGCTGLTEIYCQNNRLTALNLNGFANLAFLKCNDNQLASIELSGCSSLVNLYCYNNKIVSLNVSGLTLLDELSCQNNALTSLNAAGCTNLYMLSCNGNQLTTLNVDGCTTLNDLDCSNNKLQSLDVSGCSGLVNLNCAANQLTSLNIVGCSALNNLACNDNSLAILDAAGCTALESIECYDNQLSAINVQGCTNLERLYCNNNSLAALELSGCVSLVDLDCESNKLTYLGVADCSALTHISCSDNNLQSLDVSGCAALSRLYCNDNGLTALVLTGCTALSELNCANNQLASLDLGSNKALTSLNCARNKLLTLDLSGCTALSTLSCGNQTGNANAYWSAGHSFVDMGTVVTKANIARISQISGGSLDSETGILALELPEGAIGSVKLNYSYNTQSVTSNKDMAVTLNVAIAGVCEHIWDKGKVEVEANCIEAGKIVYTCTECNEIKTEKIDPASHKLEEKEADYIECKGGYKDNYYVCIHCEQLFADAEGASPAVYSQAEAEHSLIEETVPAKEATAEEAGWSSYKLSKCEMCGDTFKPDGSEYTEKELQEYIKGFEVHVKAESVNMRAYDGQIISNTTIYAEMSEDEGVMQLNAEVLPSGALSDTRWTSSDIRVATVDENGLVHFVKPGVTTITATATDGSKKSASVKIEVLYLGIASTTRFTAAIATESCGFVDAETGKGQPLNIGLQMGDSVQMYVYGTDKTTPLPASLFTYEPANAASAKLVEIDDNGIITAIKDGGTASVKASFRDDPLNRSITVSVKTIPVQAGRIKVIPDLDSPNVVGIDGNGHICGIEGAVSYAIFVDKLPLGTPAAQLPSFNVKLEVTGADGKKMYEEPGAIKGKHIWASTGITLATVKENADGTATISVKANVDGACTITATAKDATKAQGSIAVYITDYSPRLSAASVTLDSQMLGMATLGIVESYEASITSIDYLDVYDIKTKTYSSSGAISVSVDQPNKYEDEFGNVFELVEGITLKANKFLKNQTIMGRLAGELKVNSVSGIVTKTFEIPLNVVIKNSIPTVTVKQLTKFNTFYTDSTAQFSVTVKDMDASQIENMRFVSDTALGAATSFKSDSYVEGSGTLSIRYNDSASKLNTKGTLYVKLYGYNSEIEKPVIVQTVATKPNIALESIIGTANFGMGTGSVYIRIMDKTSKAYLDISQLSIEPDINCQLRITDNYTLELVKNDEAFFTKGGKVSLSIQDENWLSPIVLAYTLKVNALAVTVKPKTAILTVNSKIPGMSVSTEAVFSHANINGEHIESMELTPVKENDEEAKKLKVSYAKGQFIAEIKDNSIKNGSYAYSFKPECVGYGGEEPYSVQLAETKLTVMVVNTQPTGTLSKALVSLNSAYADSKEELELSLAYIDAAAEGLIVEVAALKPNDETEKLDVSYADGIVSVKVKDEFELAPPKIGLYSYTLKAKYGETEYKPINFTISVVNTPPSAKLSKMSMSLSNIYVAQKDSFVLSPVTAGHSVYLVDMPVSKAVGATAAEAAKIDFKVNGNAVEAFIKDQNDAPKIGVYSYTVTAVLNTENGLATIKPLAFTVRVLNTAPTAKLSKTTLTLNNVFTDYTENAVLTPIKAEHKVVEDTFQFTSKATGNAALEAEKIELIYDYESNSITARIKDEHKAAPPKAGTYSFSVKVLLDTDGTEYGEGYIKDLLLYVKVVNTLPKVTLSAMTLNLNTTPELAGLEKGMISLVPPAGYEVVSAKVERTDTVATILEQSGKISITENVTDGRIFASLNKNDLPKAGSYKFKVTPRVQAVGSTAESVELAAINFVVKVYANAKYSALVSVTGKLDAALRSNFITYTLTALTNVSGDVYDVSLEGQDKDMFNVELSGLNAKGQPTVKLSLKDGMDYSTNVTYKIQLVFHLMTTGEQLIKVATNVLSVRVSSTIIKLTAEPKLINIYQSQSRSRIVYYTLNLTSPAGAEIGKIETGVTGVLQKSLVRDSNVSYVYNSDGSVTVKVVIKDTSKLNANTTYTLPLLVSAKGGAANAATKLNLSLKVLK